MTPSWRVRNSDQGDKAPFLLVRVASNAVWLSRLDNQGIEPLPLSDAEALRLSAVLVEAVLARRNEPGAAQTDLRGDA